MCDFVTYCKLCDKVWSNISFSVAYRFLFPADGSDEIYLTRLELRNYKGAFNVSGGVVESSNRRMMK